MAALSLGGVNLDVQGLVAQLMNVERAPLFKLQAKESEYQSQLSAFGRLKSALSSFQTSMGKLASIDKFETYKVSTSESDSNKSFTATVDSNAAVSNYSVQVTQLATTSKYGSNQFGADTQAHFSSTSSPIATAGSTLDISVGSESMSVAVDGLGLSAIRDAINAQAEADDVAVSASIVTTEENKHFLVLTGSETGADNDIIIADNDAKTNLKFGTGTEARISQAVNATVEIDGQYTISSASNTVKDSISGVTLNLLKVSGSTADMTIKTDVAAARKSMDGFVSGYNTLLSTINALKENGLEGDSSLNSILNSIRNEFNTSAGLSGSFNYLSEIGITSDAKTGELTLDSSVLDKAVSRDYEGIAQLFANDNQGIAFRLEQKMDDYLDFEGLIKSREDGLNSRIDYNGEAQLRLEYRLEKIEARYLSQFSALDAIISQSNATSSYLTQQLANLPGVTR